MEYNHGSNRALNFGTMKEHLTNVKADVIFLCVGMNDSFAGDTGLRDFELSMQKLLATYRTQKFNGKTPPRIVLVSPIAHEHLGGEFADPKEHNKNLEKYTQEMRKVADQNKHPFVDLFTPTSALMKDVAQSQTRVTINGIHLNQLGYWAAAHYLMDQLEFALPRWSVNLKGAESVASRRRRAAPPCLRKRCRSLLRYLPFVTWAEAEKQKRFRPDDRKEICLRAHGNRFAIGPFIKDSPMQNDARGCGSRSWSRIRSGSSNGRRERQYIYGAAPRRSASRTSRRNAQLVKTRHGCQNSQARHAEHEKHGPAHVRQNRGDEVPTSSVTPQRSLRRRLKQSTTRSKASSTASSSTPPPTERAAQHFKLQDGTRSTCSRRKRLSAALPAGDGVGREGPPVGHDDAELSAIHSRRAAQ